MDTQTLLIALAVVVVVAYFITSKDVYACAAPMVPAAIAVGETVAAIDTTTASRFCDRSARDAADYGESQEDGVTRSGYSRVVSTNTSRFASDMS